MKNDLTDKPVPPATLPSDAFLDASWDDLAETHPTGQFQFVLKEVTAFIAEYQKKDVPGKPINRVQTIVFSLITKDDSGVLRIMDTKRMSLKINSSKADLHQFLSSWFGGIKIEEFKSKVPNVGRLIGRNGFITVNHETSARGTSYAVCGAPQQIVAISGKPSVPDLAIPDDFHYEPYASRQGLEPFNDTKFRWLQPFKANEEEEGTDAQATRSGGQQRPTAGGKATDAPF